MTNDFSEKSRAPEASEEPKNSEEQKSPQKGSMRAFFCKFKSHVAAEKKGIFPQNPHRWSLKKTLFAFFLWFFAVFFLVLFLGETFWPALFPNAALISGAVIFGSGLFLIFGSCIIRARYGLLVEFAFALTARTGLPLAAALAFFGAFDNILFNAVVLTMVAFYLAMLPFEVWMMLPVGQKSTGPPATKE